MDLVYSLMAPFRSVSSVLVGALALLRAAHAQDDFASDCSSFIDKISLDNVTVTSTEFVAAGTNLTVKQLLDTLQEVMDFESSIERKYATPVSNQ